MTPLRSLIIIALLCPLITWAGDSPPTSQEHAVSNILDKFHQAAADADGKTYFSLFHPDGVFIGTDAAERWTVTQFQGYAQPYFDQGKGWSYQSTSRHINLSSDKQFAWFDELLWNDKYGQCRGSGALIKTKSGWRLMQYHLTFPIPNELAKEITEKIKAHAENK